MAGINVTKLKNLVVCLPPLELQHQFDAIFEKQQCLAVSQKASLQYLNRLQASLQHRAFHGEL